MHLTHNEGKAAVAECLWKPKRIKPSDIWLQYPKMCILIN